MLDTSEGPARTRRRMIQNHEFYEKYPSAYNLSTPGKSRSPTSAYSDSLYRAQNPEMPSPTKVGENVFTMIGTETPIQELQDIDSIARKLEIVSSFSAPENEIELEIQSSPTGSNTEPLSPTCQPADSISMLAEQEPQSVLYGRILDKGDRVRYMFRRGSFY